MRSGNDTIMIICDVIVDIVRPNEVLLFGSGADNTMHDESDLDFLVVVDDNVGDKDITVRREIYTKNIRIPLDIVYVTSEALSLKLSMHDSAFEYLYNNAKVIYASSREL